MLRKRKYICIPQLSVWFINFILEVFHQFFLQFGSDYSTLNYEIHIITMWTIINMYSLIKSCSINHNLI